MYRDFPETDWKQFKRIHPVALERLSERILDECSSIIGQQGGSGHDRYVEIYRMLKDREKEMASAFNDWRRSTALHQLILMHRLRLIRDDELRDFTNETQAIVTGSWSSLA